MPIHTAPKPIIAYDIDGVVIDWFMGANNFVVQHNLVPAKLSYEDLVDHDLCTQWGVTIEEMATIMNQFYAQHPIETLPVIPGAIETINRLSQYFDTLFITARRDALVSGTVACLDQYITAPHDIHFSLGAKNPHGGGDGRKAKQEISEELGAVCMIEDNPHEVLEWTSQTVEIICHARPWNRCLTIIERLTWPEIEEYILNKFLPKEPLTQTN